MTRRRQSGPRVAAGCVRIAVLFSPFGGATRTCQTDGSWTGTAPTSCGVFSGGQNLTPAMDAQLSTWMEQKGLSSAGGWQLCYSSPNGDLRDAASTWHSRCDGHVRTVVVGSFNGVTFGGYHSGPWDSGGYDTTISS